MKAAATILLAAAFLIEVAVPQDLHAAMDRAERRGREAASLLDSNALRPYWADNATRLVYRLNSRSNEHRFFQIDLKTGVKSPAFDHAALAQALATAAARDVRPEALPIDDLDVTPDPGSVRFRAFGQGWSYQAAQRRVVAAEVAPQPAGLIAPDEAARAVGAPSGGQTQLTIENGTAGELEMFWLAGGGQRKSYGKIAAGHSSTLATYRGHAWVMTDASGADLAGVVAKDVPSVARVTGRLAPAPRPRASDDPLSPDGHWRAVIRDHNLALEPAAGGERLVLTTTGTPADGYSGPLQWAPDSTKLIAWRAREVATRQIHLVQAAPPDQLQPKFLTIDYPKPGDPIRQPKPRLFDIAQRREIAVDDALFANPWSITAAAWSGDSAGFSFAYNQRGHQLLRLVALRADTGSARSILEERSQTFIDYSQKFYLHRLPATRELLWCSERDGHNHIYLIDADSGRIKCQITKGEWNVREVVEVDEPNRQLLLKVVGVTGQDPYYQHFVRVSFEGGALTRLTTGEGNHEIAFSPDRHWLLDTWSRVDLPPVVEIRRADTGRSVAELTRADDSALQQTGWSRPQRFTAKGRDGSTDIYGIIIRPSHFDPAKKYPVLEDIYAGPHDHFVPKSYFPWSNKNAMAELGFIIVSIDGMGTNWRSKAFHDVCWKNLADAGFPDRIAWLKAAAASRPWMDLTRVGIYGGSAGGQNALAGLLQHGDFYQAGVADCGCHDNRMDKMWWNEAWMGWPVDDSYARNSNVTHAARLTGKLLLVVGELDHNVDPASTAQVAAALQQAGKDFEMLTVMNADHGAAETPYGKYRRAEFLVRHLRPAAAGR